MSEVESMTQEQRLDCLIDTLKAEDGQYRELRVPENPQEKRHLLRGLLNLRPPRPVSKDFLAVQDAYLQGERDRWGAVPIGEAEPTGHERLFIWQGDITRLAADAIVNAANSALLGCFIPCHGCIDNAIHSAAGVQLRLACHELMQKQGEAEPTGTAKITPGYNLPAPYVLHTVGPIINGPLTEGDRAMLAKCYHSCLALAAPHKLESIAFCCISTGEFRFPQKEAAEIAVQTVLNHIQEAAFPKKVIFNVFKDPDYSLYKRILG